MKSVYAIGGSTGRRRWPADLIGGSAEPAGPQDSAGVAVAFPAGRPNRQADDGVDRAQRQDLDHGWPSQRRAAADGRELRPAAREPGKPGRRCPCHCITPRRQPTAARWWCSGVKPKRTSATASNKVFALRGNNWVELPSLTHARAAPSAAVVGDKLVVVGGQNAKQLVPADRGLRRQFVEGRRRHADPA